MTLDELRGRLKGVHMTGEAKGTAFCPAHDDREHRSLSFAREGGKLLVNCFRGCTPEKITAALGWSLRDLFLNGHLPGEHGSAPLTLEELATAKSLPVDFLAKHGVRQESWGLQITYLERDGTPAGRQRRRTAIKAKDGSSWAKGPGSPIPYGRWRLDAAAQVGELFLVEGETDALAAWYHDVPALGIPGSQMAKVLAAEDLRGVERLFVVQEPDDAGAAFVANIGTRLRQLRWSGRAAVLRLPVKDLADLHLTAGARFSAQLEAAQQTAAPLTGPTDGGGVVLVRLGDVPPEAIEWLWPERLAFGKIALFTGDPGLGKSLLTLDVAARATTGRAWPASNSPASVTPVILLSAEDGIADTIRPRIDRHKGDAGLVHVLRAVHRDDGERRFRLTADLPALEQAMRQTRARLVIIDPISAYIGDRDSFKDAEVRAVLAPLAELAERTRAAVLGVMHLNKDQQRRLIYRTGGSIAFVAAARAVFVIGSDPEDRARRLLVPIKSNLSAAAPTLAFRVVDGTVEWEAQPVTSDDPDELLGTTLGPETHEARAERTEAERFLSSYLADRGGKAYVVDILKAAKANGISERTLRRAKASLKIGSDKEATTPDGRWLWTAKS